MSILKIIIYPDKRLRLIAKKVKKVDFNTKNIINDMFDTMYFYNGIGLSATQININKRIIIMDVYNEKIVLINPEIIKKSDFIYYKEGCLSIPNVYFNIKRYKNILVKALNIDNNIINLNAENLLSVCIQHEIDHLNGILFIDYIKK